MTGPAATADVIIEREGRIVLVRRKWPPPGWALPGGFVDAGERVGEAAVREAKEETGMNVRLTALLHVYSDPVRDPRRATLSAVFLAESDDAPEGGDDAAEAHWFSLDDLPSPLAFDHAQIIEDYRRFRATGERPPPLR